MCSLSCSFSCQPQVPGGGLLVRPVCCDTVKAKEEGCVLASPHVFFQVPKLSPVTPGPLFLTPHQTLAFYYKWLFTRLRLGNIWHHLARCLVLCGLQLTVRTGSFHHWVLFSSRRQQRQSQLVHTDQERAAGLELVFIESEIIHNS